MDGGFIPYHDAADLGQSITDAKIQPPAGAPALSPVEQLKALPPEPPKPVTHDVTIVTTKKLAQAKAMGVPPEEFGIERGARTIKDCNYCFHETSKTVGDLEAQGFDREQLDGLVTDRPQTTETLSRDTVDEDQLGKDTLNKSARLVRVTEHYIRMDYEGTGRPCIYRVTTAGEGGEILTREGKEDIKRVDDYPFAGASPVPVTHRFFGRSIADLTMQVQREKTALKRGMLDNIYLSVNPRVELPDAAAGPNTIDDLLVSRPGGIVRTKGNGGMLQWQVVPNITAGIFPMIQYLDGELETKTGVTKQGQGIDANALQNQSATAVAQVFSASQMRTKLIARILAEGIRDMFALLHGTIRKHGQQQQTVRLRNAWVDVDPRNWKTRNDMTINVGLGTGGRAQQFAQAMALANVQKEMLAGGKANLVGDQELYNTAAEITKIMGHKNPDKFFNDPSAKDPKTGQPLHPPIPPPPSPEEVKGKVKLQIAQQQAQLNQQADERKAQIEQVQAQADIATQDKKTQVEMAQTDREFDLKAKLAMMQAQLDAELAAKEEARKEREFEQKMAFEREKHQAQMRQAALGMVATAQSHDAKITQGAQSHEQKLEQAKQKPKGPPK